MKTIRLIVTSEIADALCHSMYKSVGSRSQDIKGGCSHLVIEEVDEDLPTFAIEGNGCRPSHLGSGISAPNGKMFTVNTTEVHGVMYWENDDVDRQTSEHGN